MKTTDINIKPKNRFFRKIIKYFFLSLLILTIGFFIYFFQAIKMPPPKISNISSLKEKRETLGENFYGIKNNRLRKNQHGLWELYVEGNAFERGVYNGKLTAELGEKQEIAFVDEIGKMIPSRSYLSFLKYFTAWFNKDMDKFIPHEYLEEIYGVSESASKKFEFIGTNYERILNYHGAHDIGHALQSLAMVGCTSFSVWGDKSSDGSLLIGRNFDFYVGDKFAEEKIVTFIKPDKGYKLVIITWGSFIGAVSGMNDQGLTITLNAAKSEIPFSAATPISILAREILQYAKNIDEAYAIAKKRHTFVAEALMIGSANDRKTAIIEKSPQKTEIFYSEKNYIIGPNHFQSKAFANEELNIENIKESSSLYRYKRMEELLKKYEKPDYISAAKILRSQGGLNDKNVGMGNEKNICQLIAHHSIIFKPEQRMFWISTNPYQLGEFICYNLDSVFANFPGMTKNREISEQKLTIPADEFLKTDNYNQFVKFKKLKTEIKLHINSNLKDLVSENIISEFLTSNPEYFYTWQIAGDYYYSKKKFSQAKKMYETALEKEITTIPEREGIEERIKDIEEEPEK